MNLNIDKSLRGENQHEGETSDLVIQQVAVRSSFVAMLSHISSSVSASRENDGNISDLPRKKKNKKKKNRNKFEGEWRRIVS